MTAAPDFSLGKTIALTGLMGAGKSAIGKRLAERLAVPFHDSDIEIEAEAGMSVADIFSRKGEPAFRAAERACVARLLAAPPHILALGGGAMTAAQTRALLRAKAATVWIKADPAILLERVSRDDDRPLLRTGDPAAIMENLARARAPFYAEADIVVTSDTGPHEQVVEEICAALEARGWLRKGQGGRTSADG